MNNIVTTSPNTNVIVVTSPGPAGQKGDRGITGLPGTINSNSGLNITGSSVFSGSANGEPTLMIIGSNVITGSLTVSGSNTFINIGPAKFTGSVDITGSLNVNGVFSGSGANLFDIPASGITGLNLSRIAVGNVTASVGTGSTWFNVSADGASKLSINSFGQVTIPNTLNVQGQSTLSSTLISGVTPLIGSATLNGQPITTAGDLTLDRIKSGDVTASVSNGANAFTLESAGSSLFKVSNSGILSGSGANLFNIPAAGIVG
jgi:cytoskeletal protein CcmA (bactofilin family)